MQARDAALRRALAVLLTLWAAGSAVAQQAYPSKPIRMIVPFPPGGGVTNVARIIGPKLTQSWGQQVIIDNRPGGNTIIGTEALVRAAPDGYTLLMISSAHVINHFLLPNLPYDSVKDFAPVATTSSGAYLLVVHASLPVKDLQQFIALARARPGQLNYSSSGTGGVQHLAGELFNIMAKVKVQHIPYKGAGPAVVELLGGQVHFSFQPPGNVLQHVRSGRLRAIAVPGEKRLASLPEVPTFAEAGLAGFEVKSWIGILAPAGTPSAVIAKLSAEIAKIVGMADTREKLAAQGNDPFVANPEQFAAWIQVEMARVGRIVKQANIRIEL